MNQLPSASQLRSFLKAVLGISYRPCGRTPGSVTRHGLLFVVLAIYDNPQICVIVADTEISRP
jgi:hypothetical protein